ncbi:hypothetical protein HNP84_008688 [Thermocatellispora tengchongensis]|uniref:Uncharacterized protein n=1 Tax=Thermocatellispora tengchongensis TaxID=1073253 RepID=A0A840PJ61_9ACTN|nr:hypothetical protein [Thermocatellispora tengchongensis]MBB5138926.1 hypothetical protein [Thermocatellispora tengchongensis]
MSEPVLDRRTLLRTALATGIATGIAASAGIPATIAAASPAAAATGPAGFPAYAYLGQPLDTASLRYNPTGELIFPCVRGTYDRMTGALGRYYLYYAPHDAPGGICLAYGDSLAGPFTEYPGNPIIGRTWSPHYSVSHVSSPHVLWHAASRRWFMYFHGENTTTRLAISADGVHFTYHGTVLDTTMVPGISEASYARVFDHAIPALGARYVMVYMGNHGGKRKIFWGWSADALSWRFHPDPLVSPAGDGITDLSSPHLLRRNDTTYLVYHGNSGKMYLTEVGDAFDREVHLGVFHIPLSGAPDRGRSAAPAFGTDRGVEYMFYEAGPRGSTVIAVARATV